MQTIALQRQFVALAKAESSTVAALDDVGAVPTAVIDYLTAQNLPMRIVPAPGGVAADIDWHSGTSLEVQSQPDRDGSTVITGCYAALAEAGALVMLSSPEQPTEFLFLPETHIVILRAEDIVADFEALWVRLRSDYGAGSMPRAMNLIVGPSRTADLGLPSKLGAHGPARVHILIIDS